MINILLTHSYFMRFDPKQERAMTPYPPLGTLYAASYLERHGVKVDLFDPLLSESEEEIRAALERTHPAVVAIYDDDFNYLNKMCLSRMRTAAFRMAEIAKEYGCFVIVHGSDSADHAEKYLAHFADLVIIGEGEQTLLEVCMQMSGGEKTNFDSIPGIAQMKNGAIVRSGQRVPMKHLDELPFPAWHLIDSERYANAWRKRHGYFSINVVTTRGCPYHCNWCAKPIYGQVYNVRSPENVVEEIKVLQAVLRPDHIWFADDIFGLKPGWVQRFADLMERESIKVNFKIQSRVDLLLQHDTIPALARAGCSEVWVGAESGSQKVLDAMEKGTTIEQIYEARKALKLNGIKTSFFLQFGYPGEEREDIGATIRMVRDLMPDDLGISISYPLPGTKFYKNVEAQLHEKRNWIDSDDLALMFRGTYSPDYYRRLHRYVHKLFRFWKGVELLSDLLKMKTSFRLRQIETILKMGYYAPAALIDMFRLSYLENQ